MIISKRIINLHNDLISFGSKIQEISSQKIVNEHHISERIYSVFFKITAYGITLHRSILTLCESGWTHITTVLLRSLIECSVNCLAIINNDFPNYMAFKYLYHPYIQIMKDNEYKQEDREKARLEIEKAIKDLNNTSLQDKANDYVNSNRLDNFWFKPDENGIGSIIKKYGGKEIRFVYGTLSMPVHASHLGLFLFKDDSDDIDINPCENPKMSKSALIMSCRLLVELLNIRNSYERLGFDSEYDKFKKRILKFKYDNGLKFG